MEFKLQIAQSFENDLDAVLDYISNIIDNYYAADRLLRKIKEKLTLITENPFIYPVYHDEDLAERGYHYTVIANYIMFYKIDETEKIVYVSRLLYGGQNISDII